MAEGTKDVTVAQVRTDVRAGDTVLLINKLTKEVQQIEIEKLIEASTPEVGGAPAYYDDFLGL